MMASLCTACMYVIESVVRNHLPLHRRHVCMIASVCTACIFLIVVDGIQCNRAAPGCSRKSGASIIAMTSPMQAAGAAYPMAAFQYSSCLSPCSAASFSAAYISTQLLQRWPKLYHCYTYLRTFSCQRQHTAIGMLARACTATSLLAISLLDISSHIVR